MARAALRGGLSWQVATVVDVVTETARARSLVLDVPDWPGHLPGQHIDVRLTADDGYQAQRSYSIATPADGGHVGLTVERVPDGEVSPYLVDELRAGDGLEMRGPSAVTSFGSPQTGVRCCSSPGVAVSCPSWPCSGLG